MLLQCKVTYKVEKCYQTIGLYHIYLFIDGKKIDSFYINLVEKYNLAGVAAWRKGFEKPEVWQLLEAKLNSKVPEETTTCIKKPKKKKRRKVSLKKNPKGSLECF